MPLSAQISVIQTIVRILCKLMYSSQAKKSIKLFGVNCFMIALDSLAPTTFRLVSSSFWTRFKNRILCHMRPISTGLSIEGLHFTFYKPDQAWHIYNLQPVMAYILCSSLLLLSVGVIGMRNLMDPMVVEFFVIILIVLSIAFLSSILAQ